MEHSTPEERFARAMQALVNKDAPANPDERRHSVHASASTGPLPLRAAALGPNLRHAGEESAGGPPVSWSSLQYSPSREMRELLLRRGLAVPLHGEGTPGSPTEDRAGGTPGTLRPLGAGARAGETLGKAEVDGGALQRHLSRAQGAPSSHLNAVAAASAGPPRATGMLRLSADWPASLALGLPSSQAAVFRPWDRSDLQRRISTFKSSTWFAKPQVISPSECARRGWINSGVDMLMCEVCRAMLSTATPLSWARAQVEKAASGSAARLDSAHKAQCPWRGSSCDPSLLGFPGQTPESLHTSFMARCAALASLAALPVLEQAALRAMEHAALQAVPGSPRSRLEALLVLSEEVPPWQWQAEGGLPSGTRSKVLSVVEHSRTPGFQDPLASLSFAQVVMIIALCGWKPRSLTGEGEGPISQLGKGSGQDAHLSPDTVWGLTVLECPLCGAHVGIWNFCTLSSGGLPSSHGQEPQLEPGPPTAGGGAIEPAEDGPRRPAEGGAREPGEGGAWEPAEGGAREPGEGGTLDATEETHGPTQVTAEGAQEGATLFVPTALRSDTATETPSCQEGLGESRQQPEEGKVEGQEMAQGLHGDDKMEEPAPEVDPDSEPVPGLTAAPGPALGSSLFHLGLTIAGGLTPTKLAVGVGRGGASAEAGLPVFGAHLSLEASEAPPPPAFGTPTPSPGAAPGPFSGAPAASGRGTAGAPPATTVGDGGPAPHGSTLGSGVRMGQAPGQGTRAAESGAGTSGVGKLTGAQRLLNSESFVGRHSRRQPQGPAPAPLADATGWPFPVDSAEAVVADMEGADEGEECNMSYRGPAAQVSQGQSVEAPRPRGLRRPRGGDVGMALSEKGENRPGDGAAESIRSRLSGDDPLPLPLTPAARPGTQVGGVPTALGDEAWRRSSPRKRQRGVEGQAGAGGTGPGAPEAFSAWEDSQALSTAADRDPPAGFPLKKRRAHDGMGATAPGPPHDAPRSRVPGAGQGPQVASSGRPPAPRFPAGQTPGTSAAAGVARASRGLKTERQHLGSEGDGMAAAGASRVEAATGRGHGPSVEPQGTRVVAERDTSSRRLHAGMHLPGSCTSLLGQFGAVCGPTQDDDVAAATGERDGSLPGPQAFSRTDAQTGPGHSAGGNEALQGGSSRPPALPAAEGEGSWDDARMGHAQEAEQEQQGESVAGGQGPVFAQVTWGPEPVGSGLRVQVAESTAGLPGSAGGNEVRAAQGEGLDAFGGASAPEGHGEDGEAPGTFAGADSSEGHGEGGEAVAPLGAGKRGGRSAHKQGASSVFATNTDFSAGAENSADSVDNLQRGAGDESLDGAGADGGLGMDLEEGHPHAEAPREEDRSGHFQAGAVRGPIQDPAQGPAAPTGPGNPVEGMGEGGLDGDMTAEPLAPAQAPGTTLAGEGGAPRAPPLSSAGEQGPSRSSGERRQFLQQHGLRRRLGGGPEASAASAGVIRAPQEAGSARGLGEREEGIISRSDREGRDAEGDAEGEIATNAGMIRYGSALEDTEGGMGGSGSVDKGAGFELEVEAEAQEGNVVDEPGPLLGGAVDPESAAAGPVAAYGDPLLGHTLGQGIAAGPRDPQVPLRSVVGGTSGLGQGGLWADSVGPPLERASLREAAGEGGALAALSFGMASAAQESPDPAQGLAGVGDGATLGSFLPSEDERGQSEAPQHASLFDGQMQGSPGQPESPVHASARDSLGGGQELPGLEVWPAGEQGPLEAEAGAGHERQQASREDTTEGKLVFDDLDGEGEAQTGGWQKPAVGEEEVEECGVPGDSRVGPGGSAGALHGASMLGGIAAGPGAMAAGLEAVGESRPHEGMDGGRSVAESAPADGWQTKPEHGVQEGSNFAQSSRRPLGDRAAQAARSPSGVALEGTGEAQGLAEGVGDCTAGGEFRRVERGNEEPASSRHFPGRASEPRDGHVGSPAPAEVTAVRPQREGRQSSDERVGDSREALLQDEEHCAPLQEEPNMPGPASFVALDTATGPEAPSEKSFFDPLRSHRPFCPWITCANAPRVTGEVGAVTKDLASILQQASKTAHPGWLQCLLGIQYILLS